MDITNLNKSYMIPEVPREDFVEYLETCCICGSKLRFTHQTDYLQLQVQEEARCPDCGIRNKTTNYTLQ
ncbi:MAG: hypothetical protein IT289_11015 [Oligoflexia bacterium]|nr:hypothetical protein [Oligoflexia bacterium]